MNVLKSLRFRINFSLALLTTTLLTGGCDRSKPTEKGPNPQESATTEADTTTKSKSELKQERDELDQSVWADEELAQRYEQFFVAFWDKLRNTNHDLTTFASVSFDRLQLPKLKSLKKLEHGIQRFDFAEDKASMSHTEWLDLLQTLRTQNIVPIETEWHHSRFQPDPSGPQSTVDFVIHAERRRDVTQRLIVRGSLNIHWKTGDSPGLNTVQVSNLRVFSYAGAGFEKVFTYSRRNTDFASAHPLILYDLDQNGFAEIILSRWNRVYWNDGGGRFREARLFDEFIPLAEAGIVADVNGDGFADFVSVNKSGQIVAYRGTSEGRFPTTAHVLADTKMPNTLAITAGDIDGDSDLDFWVTQYKPSYRFGQMPTPYYDANDGSPASLFRNDGTGQLTDTTEQSGLADKRFRRTYSTSFLDFDQDNDLDLLVVSDYAGIDLYQNNGRGSFTDVTEKMIPNRYLFGMAHTVTDFDEDGAIDLYAIGMSSTTARRLDQLGLGRKDRADIHQMRSKMGFGNHLLSWNGSRFQKARHADSVVRTGWSWGTSTFDFDLDGDRDIYVANGFRSGESCRDYCTRFWRHDIYTGSSSHDKEVESLFSDALRDLDRGMVSWNGFEHNALFLNCGDEGFVNVGFLFGVAAEFDSRAVVSNDLDGDGKPDLVVTEYRLENQGFVMDVHVFQNRLQTNNHWIGFHVPRSPDGGSSIGAKVSIETDDKTQSEWIVTGDSFLSQHAATIHFGLGRQTRVKRAIIHWLDGKTTELGNPSVDKYHWVEP